MAAEIGMIHGAKRDYRILVPTRSHAYRADGRAYSLFAAADFLADAGFDGVDLSFDTLPGLSTRDEDEGWRSVLFGFGNRAAARGLSVPVCHLPFYMPDPDDAAAMARFSREVITALKAAALLAIPDAVIHPVVRHESRRCRSSWLTENTAYLAPIREAAGRLHIRLCLENMVGRPYADCSGEAVYGSRAEDLRELADRLDMGICWDVGHAHLTGLCQSAELDGLRGRLRVVHLHDNDGVRDLHSIPGAGSVDFADVLEGLRLAGFAETSNRCLDLELKTSDMPDDPAARRAHAAAALDAARRLRAQMLEA